MTMVVLSDVTDSRKNAKQREEFFANASHELKTPLTAIKGFSDLAAIHNKDEGITKYIQSITRETDRMLSLIGDMLRLSELESADEGEAVFEHVSLSKVIDEVHEALLPILEEKGVSFSFRVTGEAMVYADYSHVYELVKNITENAIKYNNRDGRATVMVRDEGKSTILVVDDDGIGISPGEQTRIFERFYRVEKSRSQRGGGTGLGLSIVKHICAIYGWKLSLKSKLGLGTVVTVEFN